MQGASKPVSHISRTITSLRESLGSFARLATSSMISKGVTPRFWRRRS